jgi:hypothetical protein
MGSAGMDDHRRGGTYGGLGDELAVRGCKLASGPKQTIDGQLPYRGVTGIQMSGCTVLAPTPRCSVSTRHRPWIYHRPANGAIFW